MTFRLAHLFRLQISLGVAGFILLAPYSPAIAEENARFGLWVESEGTNQPFISKKNFETYLEFAKRYNFSDLFCQVYRGGRSWYPSMLADDTPYREAVEQGFDPLGDSIKRAHARGVKVHAWINVLRITRNKEAPLLKVLGREVVLSDHNRNSLLDYDAEGTPPGKFGKQYKLETPGYWLDPSYKKLREYIVQTIEDVLLAYPELDGIHLDMVRMPFTLPVNSTSTLPAGAGYGYSQNSIDLFRTHMAGDSPAGSRAEPPVAGPDWDEWRRSQVTLLVFEIKEMMSRVAPGKELSAAVLAWQNRAYSSAFQDWSGWLAGGALDTAIPMAYTADTHKFGDLSREAASYRASGKVLMGIGAWLLLNEQSKIVPQAEAALKAGNDGVVLFSYSNLLSPKGEKLAKKAESSRFLLVENTTQN